MLSSLAILALGCTLVPGVAVAVRGPVRVRIEEVRNWTADPLLSEVQIDSLFRDLLTRRAFTRYHPTNKSFPLPSGSRTSVYPNPFCASDDCDSADVEIIVRLDLEQASYGPTKWTGLLWGFELRCMVQYRATIQWPFEGVPTMVLAYGGYAPDEKKEPRSASLFVAHKRALWELGYSLAEAADKRLRLGLEHRNLPADEKRDSGVADSWLLPD
jgi:hypothetical protein